MFPKYELVIAFKGMLLNIGNISDTIPNNKYSIKNPLITPYIVPPNLLNCLIIGIFVNCSLNSFSTSSIIFEVINIIIKEIALIIANVTFCATTVAI